MKVSMLNCQTEITMRLDKRICFLHWHSMLHLDEGQKLLERALDLLVMSLVETDWGLGFVVGRLGPGSSLVNHPEISSRE